MREGDEEVDGVVLLESAAGLGQLVENLDQRQPSEERSLVLERAEPGRVDELEELVIGAAINGALARMVPCARRTVLFLGTASGVVSFKVWVVVCKRCDPAVVRCTCRYGNLVVGVLEDSTGGVAGIGAFECDSKADVEEGPP